MLSPMPATSVDNVPLLAAFHPESVDAALVFLVVTSLAFLSNDRISFNVLDSDGRPALMLLFTL